MEGSEQTVYGGGATIRVRTTPWSQTMLTPQRGRPQTGVDVQGVPSAGHGVTGALHVHAGGDTGRATPPQYVARWQEHEPSG